LPSEIIAAFLWAQIENIEDIQQKRKSLWNSYYDQIQGLNTTKITLPIIPDYATNNGHMFYVVCSDFKERTTLIERLKNNGFHAVFHYISLHSSSFYEAKHDGRNLLNTDRFSDCLLRLPLFYELHESDIKKLVSCLNK